MKQGWERIEPEMEHATYRDASRFIECFDRYVKGRGKPELTASPNQGRIFYKAKRGYSLRRQIFIGGISESTTENTDFPRNFVMNKAALPDFNKNSGGSPD